jgi:hypothetical protein
MSKQRAIMNHEVFDEHPASEFRVIAHKRTTKSTLSKEFAGAFSDALNDILHAETRRKNKV